MKYTPYMTKIVLPIAELVVNLFFFLLCSCANNNQKKKKNYFLSVYVLLVTVCPVALIWNENCCCRTDYKYYFI